MAKVLQIDFDYDVAVGTYDGGTLYVISDENDNVGQNYPIVSNTENSITVGESLTPRTTFAGGDISGNNE